MSFTDIGVSPPPPAHYFCNVSLPTPYFETVRFPHPIFVTSCAGAQRRNPVLEMDVCAGALHRLLQQPHVSRNSKPLPSATQLGVSRSKHARGQVWLHCYTRPQPPTPNPQPPTLNPQPPTPIPKPPTPRVVIRQVRVVSGGCRGPPAVDGSPCYASLQDAPSQSKEAFGPSKQWKFSGAGAGTYWGALGSFYPEQGHRIVMPRWGECARACSSAFKPEAFNLQYVLTMCFTNTRAFFRAQILCAGPTPHFDPKFKIWNPTTS